MDRGSPGRTNGSLKEDARAPDTVVPLSRHGDSCGRRSRPGPVFGCGDGVFRACSSGKYSCNSDTTSPPPHSLSVYSPGTVSHHLASHPVFIPQSHNQPAPGRTQHRTTEAPDLSSPVALPASGQQSRPGPADRDREGVFQTSTPGEYSQSSQIPIPDTSPVSSIVSPTTGLNDTKNVLSIYYQNVGGTNSCLVDYLLACSSGAYDVIVLTETWLDDRTQSHQLFGSGYDVFRTDRSALNSRKTTGGGVAVAVRRSWGGLKLDNTDWTGVEQVWVSIALNDRKLFLCAVYLPPDRVKDPVLIDEHNISITSVLSSTSPCDDVVILGDFNLPNVKWRPLRDGFMYPDPTSSCFPAAITSLFDTYNAATLRQINDIENENGRMLDLCFVSHRDYAPAISMAPVPLVKHVQHHPPLLLSLDTKRTINFAPTAASVRYNFYKADIGSISVVLSSINWGDVLDREDIDLAVQTFSHILGYVIDRHVPKKPTSDNHVPWVTKNLTKLKTTKKAALNSYSGAKARRLGNDVVLPLRAHYLRLNQAYKRQSRWCFANYQRRIQQNMKRNPKAFWKYVNEQRKERGLPTTMFLEDEIAASNEDICRLFALNFSNMYDNVTLSPEQVSTAARSVPIHEASLNRLSIDDAGILAAAAKLKSSTSLGPDGIPSLVLKKCVQQLLVPIRHLFDLSLSSGKFPALWKTANMFPVHKKGDRANIGNYRGISTLCAISKLFELAVLNPVFFHCKRLISDSQHGFMPGRSTTTNLLEFTSYVTDGFSAGCQTDAIYTDLSAAFDKLNHAIAIAKLERMGIRGVLLRWFESYLIGRTNCVMIGDCMSPLFPSPSGIPQGSHLGPVVFSFDFNDCNHVIEGPRLSYADDLKIFGHVRSTADAMFLQQQLDRFAAWCDTNRMVLNPSKCSVVSFSRKRDPITFDYKLKNITLPRVDCINDLGVHLDTKLTYKEHIAYIVSKASRQLGFIFRTAKSFTDVYCLKSLYCALVRSTLEYCSAVWNPHYQNSSDRIESVQRRFIRFALRLLPWRDPQRLPSYESRCQLINLDTLNVRRNTARAMVISDVLTSRIDCPAILQRINLLARGRQLRNPAFLWIPIQRTNYSAHGAITGLQRVFNRVASVFDFNLSRDSIKRKFMSFFRLRQ